jgi:hypothetical protein
VQGCLAGSHKDCILPCHDAWKQNWATQELRGPDWPAETPPVHRVEGKAGDAVIFTEKLMQCAPPDGRLPSPLVPCVSASGCPFLCCLCSWLADIGVAGGSGTVPWKGHGERRTLFYKYVPWGVHWRDGTYDMAEESGLTEAQKALVAQPPVFYTAPWFNLDTPQPRL